VANQIKRQNQSGFSLLEVMIAITLFAFFVTAFLTAQGYNVSDSELSEEQLMLQQLCEKKINELVLNPPKFQNLMETNKETKTFEESEFKDYEYTLELKRLTIPDFAQLFGQKGGVTDEAQDSYDGNYLNQNSNQRNSSLEQMVFSELKKNIERMIWQAKVTVSHKETKLNYSLSTFLTNYDEKAQLNVGF
jgi:prepilin-type N-terminal cleavage/methylation domain-containing protein